MMPELMERPREILDSRTDRVNGMELPLPVPVSPVRTMSFDEKIAYLLSQPHETLLQAPEILGAARGELPALLHRAFWEEEPAALLAVHRGLFAIYEASFANPLSAPAQHEHSPWVMELRAAIEEPWIRWETQAIEHRLPAEQEACDPQRVMAWFIAAAREQTPCDLGIVRFLAERATLDDFRRFVLIDAHLNYRFYDALALAMLHFSETVKAELSHHMWDEAGEGAVGRAHTVQFTRALQSLGLERPQVAVWRDWRAFAGYNLYLCLGLNRRHYFKALGSLAMPELFDPDRDRAVIAGLERLGFSGSRDFSYYYSHIEGDEEHGPAWLEGVIVPVITAQPAAARELTIGGAIRMQAMRRFNEYLADEFGLSPSAQASGVSGGATSPTAPPLQ